MSIGCWNADAAYAIWRSCYDGDEVWLNDVPRGQHYHAGDIWGCVGRWFAGNWYTSGADGYINQVKKFLREQIWTRPGFLSRTCRGIVSHSLVGSWIV